MAERLTEKHNNGSYTGKGNDLWDILTKLGKLEDILEKYDIESVEELGKKLADGIIWERACELACKEAPMHCPDPPEYYNAQNEYGSDEPYFIQISACEFSDDVGRCLECQMDYFYQQAKGEE